MQLTEKEYLELKKYIIIEGKTIYENIKNKYGKYLKDDNKIMALLQNDGEIIVDDYNEADIKLFGGIDKVPPGHGGRRKNDNKIHVYPYSWQLNSINNFEELKKIFINDIIIHENFHFYAQPDLYDQRDLEHGDDGWFGNKLTEGIVQTFTNIYINEHNLEPSYSTYTEEVLMVSNIIKDLTHQGKNQDEITSILLNDNQVEIIDKCENGELIKQEYIAKAKLHQNINGFLKNTLTNLTNDKTQQDIFRYCATTVDVNQLQRKLITEFPTLNQETNKMFDEYNNNISLMNNVINTEESSTDKKR